MMNRLMLLKKRSRFYWLIETSGGRDGRVGLPLQTLPAVRVVTNATWTKPPTAAIFIGPVGPFG